MVEYSPKMTPTVARGPCPKVSNLLKQYRFFVQESGDLPGPWMQEFFKGQDLPSIHEEIIRGLNGGCLDVRPDESILAHARLIIEDMMMGRK